jgi:HD-like signal output (HDOD) protein
MFEAEKEVIGATHMDVGSFLAQKWKLPPYLADIILNHHNPADAQLKDITALISIANLLAKAREISCGGDTISFVLKDQGAWLILKKLGHPMDTLDLERITFEMEDIGQEVQKYISTVLDQPSEGNADG